MCLEQAKRSYLCASYKNVPTLVTPSLNSVLHDEAALNIYPSRFVFHSLQSSGFRVSSPSLLPPSRSVSVSDLILPLSITDSSAGFGRGPSIREFIPIFDFSVFVLNFILSAGTVAVVVVLSTGREGTVVAALGRWTGSAGMVEEVQALLTGGEGTVGAVRVRWTGKEGTAVVVEDRWTGNGAMVAVEEDLSIGSEATGVEAVALSTGEERTVAVVLDRWIGSQLVISQSMCIFVGLLLDLTESCPDQMNDDLPAPLVSCFLSVWVMHA